MDDTKWTWQNGRGEMDEAKWTSLDGRGEMDEARWTRQNYEMTGKLGFNLHLSYFIKYFGYIYLYTTCEKFEEPFFSLGCLDKYKIMLWKMKMIFQTIILAIFLSQMDVFSHDLCGKFEAKLNTAPHFFLTGVCEYILLLRDRKIASLRANCHRKWDKWIKMNKNPFSLAFPIHRWINMFLLW